VKLLPCQNAACATQAAEGLYRGKATLRGGGLYVMGRSPVAFPYRFSCSTCKRVTALNAVQWNSLPQLSVADLTKLGMIEKLTQDLRGAGWKPEEAVDLFGAGFSGPAALEPLDRANEPPLQPDQKKS
jgi:hypothetical protein